MNIKWEAVLFDLDGVLVDACDWHFDALNEALSDVLGTTISRKDHEEKYNGLPTRVKLEMLGVDDENVFNQIWNKKQNYTTQIINDTAKTMSEKIELHEYLKSKNIKIACVTNSIEKTAKLMLEKTGQLKYIDLVVANEKVKRNKPYPDCYNFCLQELNLTKDHYSLSVEDSKNGILSAMSSNCGMLWAVKNSTEVNLINFLDNIKTRIQK